MSEAPSLHKLWSAIEEYPATYLNHINVNQSITAFVDRAQDIVQVFQDGKTITNVFGNMTAPDTISVRDHRHVAGFLYFQMTTLLHNRIRKIKNAFSCETTRKQLTDINTNAHAFIDFLYSRVHPEELKHITEIGDLVKGSFDTSQDQFSERKCEKSCLGDCTEICTEDCKKSCKSCTDNCADCEKDCVYDCVEVHPTWRL